MSGGARRLVLVAVVLACGLAAACGGGGPAPAGSAAAGEVEDQGTASLWVTRDRGAEVLLTAEVPAGLTVLQALDRVAEVETRYGGRFVQSIAGVSGSLASQRDWFYFLNGIEPDRGAAETRLRDGDIAWWDFRAWSTRMQQPVVVGAFPEPFLHGWDGQTRPVEVSAPAALAEQQRALEALLHGPGTGEPNRFRLVVEPGASGAVLTAKRGAANDSPVTFTLSGSEQAVRAAADALVADPSLVRYRYMATFDEAGTVTG
ncbi:MAG: DUF4430 domain-containing protein [Thermoleophilia bacterium]|nr:DUF4430 domain-containing protein [Thermoleophilia bacterium]